jgi:hypothetical protein
MATNESEYAIHVDVKGKTVCVLPGDEIPDNVKVENPYVLGDEQSGDEGVVVGDGPPPLHGKGSGRDPWAKYADDNGVEVDPEWGRDDIVGACEEAGIPVE